MLESWTLAETSQLLAEQVPSLTLSVLFLLRDLDSFIQPLAHPHTHAHKYTYRSAIYITLTYTLSL